MKTNWRSTGAEQGLWVNVISDRGHQIRVATHEDAFNLVTILNQLEEAAAFGWQCIQAIAATPPASPWQPIDTAPRDGSRILLYDRGVIVEGYYVGAPCFWVIVDRYDDSCLPTHWMPLPEPPVKGDS